MELQHSAEKTQKNDIQQNANKANVISQIKFYYCTKCHKNKKGATTFSRKTLNRIAFIKMPKNKMTFYNLNYIIT